MVQMIGKYGTNLKPPSYHEIGEKYLKLEVQRTMNLVAEFKRGLYICLEKMVPYRDERVKIDLRLNFAMLFFCGNAK